MYLIDGHNLIGQLPDLSLHDPNDEAKLVTKLYSFAARTRKRVLVVFDRGVFGGRSRMSNGVVDVVFASHPLTADDLMKTRIVRARDPGEWVVVSNDRSVLYTARQRKMRTVSSSEFAAELDPDGSLASTRRKSYVSPHDFTADPEDEQAKQRSVPPSEVDYWMQQFRGEG